ncbi:1,2-phenylacetyl-CoA epoxidase subunit PaaD [Allosalinactinospora lopnorensis]|uniref:1,2-phenylacetyl-CoA epoxidase subunit PaaD n=1 Tax=Allosalinactinospora lopnorensis TaxID=1352348 RepID=UPI000623F69B|nr:1,2-phenylacetyl-CoA epoxidase subunit PaaD [Allosalinactinospora lopnorensis]
MTRQAGPLQVEEIRELVAGVPDPEMPMVNLADLGILRDVGRDDAGAVTVTITPTYSGCPALDTIRDDIRARLAEHGETRVAVRTELSPAWSTDRISAEGRRKLAAHGIAPPPERAPRPGAGHTFVPLSVRCPNCGALETRELSPFGSTACKALYVCTACREPFDRVKPL